MAKTTHGDIKIEGHIKEKRNELIWALGLQHYTFSEIGRIFNMHRASVQRIVNRRPRDYKPKWVKDSDKNSDTI